MADQLTSAHLAQIKQHLDRMLPGVSTLDNHPSIAAPSVSQMDFCTVWPEAVPLLTLLSQFVGFIPGAGMIGATVLSGLLTAGSTAHGQLCPPTPVGS
jgi:hypothetical protein